jgi:hypothetical protein
MMKAREMIIMSFDFHAQTEGNKTEKENQLPSAPPPRRELP